MRGEELWALDLNLLVALDALLDAGSVSGAARRLHRSQPAMSRTLGRLREMFDDPLLAPHGRGLVRTPRAEALREPLALLLSDARALVRPPTPFDAATATAHFRLLSSDYAQILLMGSVVTWLGREAPNVTLEVLPVGREALDQMASGAADLMLGPEALCPPWCQCEHLLGDAWVCLRRRGESMPRTVAGYLRLPHVAVGTELAVESPIDTALRAAAGGRARSVRLTVPDFAGALFVVASSSLVATVPEPLARGGAVFLPLSIGRLPFEPAAASVAMIWPRRLTKDPAHRWLRDAVKKSLTL